MEKRLPGHYSAQCSTSFLILCVGHCQLWLSMDPPKFVAAPREGKTSNNVGCILTQILTHRQVFQGHKQDIASLLSAASGVDNLLPRAVLQVHCFAANLRTACIAQRDFLCPRKPQCASMCVEQMVQIPAHCIGLNT